VTQPINYQAWAFWLLVVNSLATALTAIGGWWALREKVATKRFNDAEQRLASLEHEVKHPPACTYHGQLELRIDAVRSDTAEIKGTVKGINRAVDLMNEFLINQGGRRP
jgi:phosphopantetheine adenylyltransferase